jgi:hypothetical protein
MLTGRINIDNTALMARCMNTSTDKTIAMLNPDSKYFEGVVESHAGAQDNHNANPHCWPEFRPVLDCLKNVVEPDQMIMSWYNITLVGGQMKSHFHTDSVDKVLVYYVNYNPSHPPLELLIDGQWIKQNCETGTWLLFTSDTYHRVGINTGSSDRISISVNIIDKPSK